MKIWTDGYTYFEDEDEAREDAYENITWDDIEEYFREEIDFHKFFTRVREKMPDFFEVFENECCEAENAYFEDNYKEIEQEEQRKLFFFYIYVKFIARTLYLILI